MDQMRRPSYAQRWKVGFGVNMIVMAACFGLYELGFFGRVDGPLSMTNIGRSLSGMGLTSNAFQIVLVVLFGSALTWNWILNVVAHLTGQRLTCTKGSPQEGFCGELVQRSRDASGTGWTYTCPRGHTRGDAHFHPIRKGKLANSVLMASLAAALMYYFA